MSKADKVLILERVIGSLGLQEIRNSLVGTVEKRGISGGQRKRVNVGIEMVMEPSLLILDEPTTGLDSASSQQLLRALRHEASQGVNVCAVIHQPRFPCKLWINHAFISSRKNPCLILSWNDIAHMKSALSIFRNNNWWAGQYTRATYQLALQNLVKTNSSTCVVIPNFI